MGLGHRPPFYLRSEGALFSRFFVRKQLLLAWNAPAVTAHRSVGSNHSMARNQEGDGVGGTCTRHSARSRGSTDLPGHLLIGPRFPAWDGPELAPDTPLKGGGADVKRQL